MPRRFRDANTGSGRAVVSASPTTAGTGNRSRPSRLHRGGRLSEFYDSRRAVITDVSALTGFAAGVLFASAFAWRILATGFRTGELERALFYFLGIVLSAGFAGGALGLWSGKVGGRFWEGRHRRHRVGGVDEFEDGLTPNGARGAGREAPEATTPVPPSAASFDQELGVHFRAFDVEIDQFLVLLRRARPQEPNAIRTATNLGRTLNIGAYEGARLVGAVRLLTDGRFSHVAELLVDPAYADRGLDRALRERAEAWVRGAVEG